MQIIVNGGVFDGQAGLSGVMASDGSVIFPDSLAQTMTYDNQNRLTSVSVANGGVVYKQTYTYSGSSKNIAGISQWVKQS